MISTSGLPNRRVLFGIVCIVGGGAGACHEGASPSRRVDKQAASTAGVSDAFAPGLGPPDAGGELKADAGVSDAGGRIRPRVARARAFDASRGVGAPGLEECRGLADDRDALSCAQRTLFSDDARGRELALRLLMERGDFVGVEESHMMDGGFRGTIRIEPTLPKGKHLRHLEWVAASLADFDRFMVGVTKTEAPPYRLSGLLFRFMESVGRTTPSAYALDWRIGYNVNGSLLKSEDGVRETLFHEIFHLNDQAHNDWSARELSQSYDQIVKRCGTNIQCLAPYAPNSTKVRGGTYYAFQPNNGLSVREYAAELAVRYYREMRGELGQGVSIRPRFKCGPAENRVAWDKFVREFFGGVDLGPDC